MIIKNILKLPFLKAIKNHASHVLVSQNFCEAKTLSTLNIATLSSCGASLGGFPGHPWVQLSHPLVELRSSIAAVPPLARPFQSGSFERMVAEVRGKDAQAVERHKLLVIGGNGFVGSRICEEAVAQGIPVASLNRSGPPPQLAEPWVSKVEWIRGSVTDTGAWREKLGDVLGVISCVGAFGSYRHMVEVNGEANVKAVNLAAEQGVPRFVYVSAHDFGFPPFVLKGYFEGKRMAEAAVKAKFPYGGVILRPGMIHGTRRVGSVSLPLSLVGAPAEMILKNAKWASNLPLIGGVLVPPVKVTAVAKTAVRAATDPAIPSGILDVWAIDRLGT